MAFDSDASNLVPGDTNGTADVFVHDRRSGTTQRVSVATDGTQGNGDSAPGDQRRRALRGLRIGASNLVPGDTNGATTCSCAI